MMNMSFDLWMRKFDRLCMQRFGCTVKELPDWDFYSEWESGAAVEDAFDEFWTELREDF